MFIKRIEPVASGFDCYLNNAKVGTRASEDTAREFLNELAYDMEHGAPLPFEPSATDDVEQLPIPHIDGLPDDHASIYDTYCGVTTAIDRRTGELLIASGGNRSAILQRDDVLAVYQFLNLQEVQRIMLQLQRQKLLESANPRLHALVALMDAAFASEPEPAPAKRANTVEVPIPELPSVQRMRRARAERQARQNPAK